jgi:virulence-associated protein VapD
MFKLILTNGIDDCEIIFKVRNTTIAKKWFSELCKDYELFETERFTNWNETDLVTKLNSLIHKVNEYDKIIDKELSQNPKQQELNYLHRYFEDLRGDVVHGTDWWNNAPEYVKDSVEQFNILIHQLEANIRTKNHPTVVVTFKNRPILDLETEDLKYFTYKWTKGTVYINYCQVGKTVLDVFKDKASIIDAFFSFAQTEQKREAEELINTEKLNEDAAKRYILNSLMI